MLRNLSLLPNLGNSGKRHAERLRMLNVRQLAEEGQLDERIAEMVETLILVAEFETDVAKTGRKAALSKQ